MYSYNIVSVQQHRGVCLRSTVRGRNKRPTGVNAFKSISLFRCWQVTSLICAHLHSSFMLHFCLCFSCVSLEQAATLVHVKCTESASDLDSFRPSGVHSNATRSLSRRPLAFAAESEVPCSPVRITTPPLPQRSWKNTKLLTPSCCVANTCNTIVACSRSFVARMSRGLRQSPAPPLPAPHTHTPHPRQLPALACAAAKLRTKHREKAGGGRRGGSGK